MVPLSPLPGSPPLPGLPHERADAPQVESRSVSSGDEERIDPFLEEPAGNLDYDGHDVTVWGIACRSTGEVVCLNCTGPQASVSAALQRLVMRKGRIVPFLPQHPALWHGPTELIRLEEPYLLLRQALAETRLKNYCLLTRSAHIGDGLRRVRTLPPGLAPSGDEAEARAPSTTKGARYVLGRAGTLLPPPGSAYGHWKGMQIVCLPEWERLLWEMGERAGLITPLPAIGLSCWQLDGDASRWRGLVKRGRASNLLPLPARTSTSPSLPSSPKPIRSEETLHD